MTTNKESFFELTTPRDMLEKAKRELIRLEENLHIDHVYNFFTTAYHIQDYLKNGNYLSQSEVDKFFNDQDLKDCRDICHKGKHLKVTIPRQSRGHSGCEPLKAAVRGR